MATDCHNYRHNVLTAVHNEYFKKHLSAEMESETAKIR